jgi:hypothetical protein
VPRQFHKLRCLALFSNLPFHLDRRRPILSEGLHINFFGRIVCEAIDQGSGIGKGVVGPREMLVHNL